MLKMQKLILFIVCVLVTILLLSRVAMAKATLVKESG